MMFTTNDPNMTDAAQTGRPAIPQPSSNVLGVDSTGAIPYNANAAAIATALMNVAEIGGSSTDCSNAGNNACVVAATNAAPGSFTITFQNQLFHRFIPVLLFDSSALLNNGTVQEIIVPPAAGNFCLAYPDPHTMLKTTHALTHTVTDGTLAGKIHDEILPAGGTAS